MRAEEIALKYRQDSTLMKKEISIREKENQLLRLHQWFYAVVLGGLLLVAVATVLVLYFKRRRDREQWDCSGLLPRFVLKIYVTEFSSFHF